MPGTQVYAGSCIVHVALQPSPSVLFLSSQTSPGSILPSPHEDDRAHAPADGQVQLGSTWQMPLQPSPATVLPSSHCSMPPWLLMPSPPPGGHCNGPPVPVPHVVPPVPPIEMEPSSPVVIDPPMPGPLLPPVP